MVYQRPSRNLRLLYRDWLLPSHQHNWTVWNSRCIARYFYANQLYCHSKSSGASSLWWLGPSRGKHGNCWGHSAVKWSVRQETASQIPQISEYDPFDLCGETHWQYIQLAREILPYSWPDMFDCRFICCHNIFGQSAFIIRSMPDTTDIFNVPWLSGELNDWRLVYSNGFTAIYM